MAKKRTNARTTKRLTQSPFIESFAKTPILVDEDGAVSAVANLEHMVASEDGSKLIALATESNAQEDDFWCEDEYFARRYRPYVVKEGILQIPIMGTLLNRFGYQFGNWVTGYKYIEMAMKRGMEDENVNGIALIVDSPGGLVSGNFELSDLIYGFRGEKPIRAYVADSAQSAAYSLASAADSITMTRSGKVGSIGIIMTHFSYEGALSKNGIKVTHIYAGKHKVDGSSQHDLSSQALKRFQASVNKSYDVFTSTVARNRNMDDKAVRETEALTYDAEAAIENKLADNVGTLEEGLLTFAEDTASVGDNPMAKENTTSENEAAAGATEAQLAAANQEGFKAALDRVSAIMALPEAEGREDLAMHLATNSTDSVEAVTATLKLSPKAAAPEAPAAGAEGDDDSKRGKSHFAENMDAGGTPGVGQAEASDGGDEDDAEYAGLSPRLKQFKMNTGG